MAEDLISMLLKSFLSPASASEMAPIPPEAQAMPGTGRFSKPMGTPSAPSFFDRLQSSSPSAPHNLLRGLFGAAPLGAPDAPPAPPPGSEAARGAIDVSPKPPVSLPGTTVTPPRPGGGGKNVLDALRESFGGAGIGAAVPAGIMTGAPAAAPRPAAAPGPTARVAPASSAAPTVQPAVSASQPPQAQSNPLAMALRDIMLGAASVNPTSPKTAAFAQGYAGSSWAGEQRTDKARKEKLASEATTFERDLKTKADKRADVKSKWEAKAWEPLAALRMAAAQSKLTGRGGRQGSDEARRAAWLLVYPGDEKGALDYAAGRKRMSDPEIRKAAQAAAVKEFGTGLPMGDKDRKKLEERTRYWEKYLRDGNTTPAASASPVSAKPVRPSATPMQVEEWRQGGEHQGWRLKPEARDADPSTWFGPDAEQMWEKVE